ncbi:Uncharacterised protein [Acinetobacter junii]|jgi:hypothetical protein|uniref:Uncharacterized protein n=2 Tax=Acinetobacter junii TaxID=40215 RepID=A0A365PEU1_ACIJU|nr:hypothetical protein HMPREF0026_02297 [Acinetobacter junii SH205]ENV49151.1 hypothetical protein F953_03643 [Acinetobacter junii CIP 107470 = MTCC 11364]ENV68338.1 hypothetical protein F948_00031 [Acinetobacter junii CIP 64.5]MBY3625990.1 hypothetical protein [Acinetobacter sp. CUI P1]RBA32050.1 hypothetical protein DDF86_13350 [Acinetobacter junii]
MNDIKFDKKDFYKSNKLFLILVIVYFLAQYKFQLDVLNILHDLLLFGVTVGLFKLLRNTQQDQLNYLIPNIMFICLIIFQIVFKK